MSAPRFPLLDSLRGLAALSIIAFHACSWSAFTEFGGPLAPYLSRLDVGVTVFFLLSGFLLYRPFARARLLGTEAPRLPGYARRRILRIVPAYWVALTLISLLAPEPGTFEHPAVFYGFAQVYTDEPGGLSQAWSLCIEITFYALLPFWWTARSVRGQLAGLAILVAIATAWNAWTLLGAADPAWAWTSHRLLWLPSYLDQFALGMGLAVVSVVVERDGRLPRALGWLARRAWPAWLFAAAAFVVVSVGIGLAPETREDGPMTVAQTLGRHWLYGLVALGLLLPAVFGPPGQGAIRRLLGARVLISLGAISYGIYLWHLLPMRWLTERWPQLQDGSARSYLTIALVSAAGAIVAAALSWRLVERPLIRLGRRPMPLGGRPRAVR